MLIVSFSCYTHLDSKLNSSRMVIGYRLNSLVTLYVAIKRYKVAKVIILLTCRLHTHISRYM